MDEDIVTRDDRKGLLAAFARAPENKSDSTAVVTMSPPSPIERVIGAQNVAVRRDEHRFLEKIKVLAAAAGESWYYRYPVKSKSGQEWIEGPTIKLANDLAREFGNCDIDTRVTDLGDTWLILARFTDYETGFSMTRPFQQRKGQRGMKTEDARALDIALQIGASKAIRNVVVNSLQTFADFAFEEARNALVQKIGRNLEGSRKRAIEHVDGKHIELLRVERVIGRAAKDWLAPDIAKVIAILRSIDDGMTTIDEAFPPLEQQPTEDTAGSQPLDAAAPDGADERGAVVANDRTPAAGADDEQHRARLVAYEQGKQAKAAGTRRAALPGEYRDAAHSAQADAWFAGWDGKALPMV